MPNFFFARKFTKLSRTLLNLQRVRWSMCLCLIDSMWYSKLIDFNFVRVFKWLFFCNLYFCTRSKEKCRISYWNSTMNTNPPVEWESAMPSRAINDVSTNWLREEQLILTRNNFFEFGSIASWVRLSKALKKKKVQKALSTNYLPLKNLRKYFFL